MVMLSTVLLLLIAQVILGEDCDNECYRSVEFRLKNVTDSYEIPSNITDVLNRYNTVSNFTRTVEEIRSNIKLIETLIKKNLDELNRRKLEHEETVDKCNQIRQRYDNLTANVDRISKDIKNVNHTYGNIIDRINESKEKSFKLKKQLDSLTVPDFVGNNYLCNTSLGDTVQKIISSGYRITHGLEVLKDKQLDSLRTKNEEIKRIIDTIDKLGKKIEEPSLTINEETEPLLIEISKEIEALQNRLKNITITQPGDISNLLSKNYELLREFEKILKLIFSDENIKKVREKIKKRRQLIDVIKIKSKLRKEFEDIRKIVTHLQSAGVCELADFFFEP